MAEYPFPNWIRPPDIADEYSRGLELGQRAASEQQRLQFQQIQAERDHMMETQRMQIQKAYQDQQIQLRQQEVKQAQQKIDLETQDAARRLEGYKRFQAAVQGGEDAVQAAMKYLPGTGEAGGVGTLAQAFEKQRQMLKAGGDPHVETYGGHKFLVVPGEYGQRPQYHSLSPDASERVYNVQEIGEMQRQRDKIDAQISKLEEDSPFLLDPNATPGNKLQQATKSRYDTLKASSQQMDKDIEAARSRARGGAAAPAAPAPGGGGETAPALDQRPWDAPPPGGTGVGMAMPTAAGPGEAPAFNPRVVAYVGPKTPSSAPQPPAGAPSQLGVVGPYGPTNVTIQPPQLGPPAPAPTPSSAPQAAGYSAAAMPSWARPSAPQAQPAPQLSPLYDPSITPNTFAYGQAIRDAQSGLSKSLKNLKPEELSAAASRLGLGDLKWDPDRSMYFGGGLFSIGKERDALESQLLRTASERNLNPLQ